MSEKRVSVEQAKSGRKKRKLENNSFDTISLQQQDEDFVAFDLTKDNEPVAAILRSKSCPWMSKKTADIRDPLLRFHNEIHEFYHYIAPQPCQRESRRLAFLELKQLIEAAVPGSEVKQFGSSALGLELPDGDIDVTVLCEGEEAAFLGEVGLLSRVYDKLKHNRAYSRLDFRRGKVPIINVSSNEFMFDISVNKSDGLKQLLQIQRMQNGLPEFKYLFMTLKCMLKIRGYSETYHGYVGSYLLFGMVFEYLFQKYDSFASFDNQRLLSQDLIGFLDFYSTTDWSRLEVYVGRGLTRLRTPTETNKPVYFRFLSPENDDDIGARAFKIKEVFYFFRNRVQLLRHRNFRRGESLLKELLNPSLEEFAYPNRSKI